MRRRLVTVFVAVSTTVALAFVVPLALLVRTTAEDRALDRARADAAALTPVLAVTDDPAALAVAVSATPSGAAGRVTVYIATGDALVREGAPVDATPRVEQALRDRRSSIGGTDGGQEVVTAVALGDDRAAAVRVFVPERDLAQDQWTAWLILGGVAVVLVGVAVFVADQLARTVVRPSEELASAAGRLGAGDLDVRVEPDGPDELRRIGQAFNDLAVRLQEMIDREREMVAELSHRLRTPLTKLRLDVDRVADPDLGGELRGDVDSVTATVNQLIEEARRTADRQAGARADAAAVVRERVDFWSALADEEGRAWSLDVPPGPRLVPVTPAELEAVVDVLVENVFAHTPAGTAFRVQVLDESSSVVVRVDDDGPGIDPDLVEKGRSGGASTGLGLGIARRTADEAGGTFRAFARDPGRAGGGRVELRLPRLS